ncbi:MAG: hypothetical protein JWQ90_4792 [Hydrocarboniphaga sp.]|uniref:DUF1214 domain-containing protein n=1 Tax=Hydrocarboniphaga sp. TaxID=2033016 RepID=UPI002613E2BF|nr:DUF1214 domain-containing protein [Hydrocarboniphaga sp.]MDB5972342.1 hypothetical protein [Hydrocarboniphaga sp.]
MESSFGSKPADDAPARVEVKDLAELATAEWSTYIEALLPLAGRLVPQLLDAQDEQIRREFYRNLFSQLVTAYVGLLYVDPQHPDFYPFATIMSAYAGANPDQGYAMCPIEDVGVYRISGYRGTVKRVDVQIGTGSFFSRGVMDAQKLGLTLANYDFDALEIGSDGFVDVILSPARPENYSGNWLQLHPKATYLLLRQTSYDWIGEVDGRFSIERLDRAAAKPRPTAKSLDENLRQLVLWTEGWTQLSIAFAREIYREQGINQIRYKDLTEYGELLTQKYAYGGFDLAADEALIIEVQVPVPCRYWSVHLMDDASFTLDWYNRQTHLNGHTAIVDTDGFVRIVVSAVDPGVPNWLDSMGYRRGVMQVRWERCERYPDHIVTKIKVADVRQHLPPATSVVSPEEREAAIRMRRRGALMRKRW